jgi:HK97 family phage portal protein
MSDLEKRQGYFVRLWDAITGKSYAQPVPKPKEENRGAAWAAPAGVRPTYSQGASLAAYGVHGYTHAAAKRSAQDLAALPIKLLKGRGANTDEIIESDVLDLLDQPNSKESGFMFRESLLTDLMLAGNCYILLLGPRDNRPLSLVRLHPDEVRIVTDPKMGITGYEHNSSGSVVLYLPERVIHGKNYSYAKGAQSVYGCGAVEALSREIDADLNAQKLASDASAKGRPDILLYPKEDGDIWPSETRRQIADQYGGLAKQGGALVLSGQVEVRELQLSPREMEFEASRRMARESISAVLGVPPTVLGLPAANYATSRQQAINYWTNQIKKGKQLGELLTQIAQRFNPDYRIEHDYSGVEALQSVRTEQLNRVQLHILNGIDPQAAYASEGLEFPTVQQDPADIGQEEDENVRMLSAIFKAVDFGDKSNAKEAMNDLSEATQTALKRKAKEHNEEHGNNKAKKLTNSNYLAVSYHRGLGAYENNPQSVRPSVTSAQQWAMARVNSFLYALRNGRYRSGKHDTDLLPKDHPMSSEEKLYLVDTVKVYDSEFADLPVSTKPGNPQQQNYDDVRLAILGSPPNWERYKASHALHKPNQDQMLDGYLLLIARREDPEDPTSATSDRGPLVVYQDLLDRAVGLLNGSEGRLAITEEERERAYRVISRYYDKIGQDTPALSPVYLDFEAEKKNSEITNFPKRGDDLKVSLRNSQWDLFDPDYAAKLKEEYPKIWRAGGNIRGNDQYRRLTPIVKNNGVATSESEENAIRLREAWVARHEGDGAQFRDRDHPINLSTVAGLVAQIKWYGVSVIGESRMKQVLNELKRKLDKEDRSFQPDQRSQMWLDWIEKSQKQAEDGIRRRVNGYFRGARRRFVRLVEENTEQGLLDVVRAQKEEELRLLKQGYQGEFVKWFMLTGSSELDRVFRIADVARPLDLVFGRRDLAVQLSDRAAQQMTDTTINSVESIIQRGLIAGASVPQIASNLSNSLAFSQDRSLRIARTESTKAVNAATDQAYRQAATAGIDIQKQWLSSRDAKVREAHAELDGVVVGVNEEFESEGYTSPCPANFGDPSLDVNCRCTIVPVIDGKTDL